MAGTRMAEAQEKQTGTSSGGDRNQGESCSKWKLARQN